MTIKFSNNPNTDNLTIIFNINKWMFDLHWINFDNYLNYYYDDITNLELDDLFHFSIYEDALLLTIFGLAIEIVNSDNWER